MILVTIIEVNTAVIISLETLKVSRVTNINFL